MLRASEPRSYRDSSVSKWLAYALPSNPYLAKSQACEAGPNHEIEWALYIPRLANISCVQNTHHLVSPFSFRASLICISVPSFKRLSITNLPGVPCIERLANSSVF